MFHNKTIVLTVLLVCFSNLILPTEAGYVVDKLKGLAASVCNFFRPGHKSTTTTTTTTTTEEPPLFNVASEVNQDLNGQTTEAVESIEIDIRANEEGMGDEVQGARSLITFRSNCPSGQRMTNRGQCRPVYL